MDKETLGLILIMGVSGLVIFAFVLNDAYGHTEYTTTYVSEFEEHYNVTSQMGEDHKSMHILEQILEEEKKQTSLLEQQNCFILHKDTHGYYGDGGYKIVNSPLELLKICPLYPIEEATYVEPIDRIIIQKNGGHK